MVMYARFVLSIIQVAQYVLVYVSFSAVRNASAVEPAIVMLTAAKSVQVPDEYVALLL